MTVKVTRSMLKRQAIIDGALSAFQQYGVSDTSMDKIAETAQVSKRTVYNHFESKEQLVTYIIKEIWQQNILTCDIKYDADSALDEQLTALLKNELDFLSNQNLQELIRVAIGYCLFNPDIFTAEMSEFFDQETALIRWIKQAMLQGRLRQADPQVAHAQLISLLKGQAFWPQILHQQPALTQEQIDVLTAETVAFFLAYYRV
ncbi:TetR/AcrR family transcriptional regulator [Pseudoalteromonas sp. McH1-42]|uniref:TetR/AcrR family transcriptional regulator n=1 Tax=Pseudoalteromonas sp. McH1-42 TaxID=2917752 RepID=UPI001EF3FE63|nr:TetR/AcrR family transcriptional regulator [Pseudoalteromonas sp. McH1-42]MCG7562360.1 TetR/AcrR family transcriptional regulator [Pseudoalteromonas sp. McH1-42]